MRYDYKYRINNKDKGDLAMELKELTSAEQVVMKCIWDYGKDMPLQQLIENLITEKIIKEQRSVHLSFI